MAVDAATVKKIGRLARIRVNEDEVEKYQAELNARRVKTTTQQQQQQR